MAATIEANPIIDKKKRINQTETFEPVIRQNAHMQIQRNEKDDEQKKKKLHISMSSDEQEETKAGAADELKDIFA